MKNDQKGDKSEDGRKKKIDRGEKKRLKSPARALFSMQSSSGKGKQSVLIKDWINPQSDPISAKQLFIGPTSHG